MKTQQIPERAPLQPDVNHVQEVQQMALVSFKTTILMAMAFVILTKYWVVPMDSRAIFMLKPRKTTRVVFCQ